jgi:hypothetical protein
MNRCCAFNVYTGVSKTVNRIRGFCEPAKPSSARGDSTVRPRFHRIPGSALLTAALSVAQLACTTYTPVHSDPRPRDHVVESCQQSVRAQVSDRFGASARVGFDTPETYYISSARQGVRGGGVIGSGGDRARIHYDCSVNIHSGRVVDVNHRLVDASRRSSEWSVDACQSRIRHEVASESRRQTTLNFEPAKTWFISLDREGVRGTGKLASGNEREKIRYECEVDIRRGRIEAAHYRPVEKAPMTDKDTLRLCQAQITDEVKEDRGRSTKISFVENKAYSISRFEKGVQGKAKLKSGDDRDSIAYECRVNTRRERVTDAHYRLLEKPRPSREHVVELCQMVTREMAAADHGRRAAVEFDDAETVAVSEREMRVRGSGRLRVRGDRDPIRYSCSVDLRKVKVTDARYRPVEQPRQSTQRTLDMCHAELRRQIASDREESASLKFDTSETFFVSNAIEGVRGKGVVRVGRRERDPIRYECEVNIRRGNVKEARYRYR